ncbi:MAG: NHLP leader peptide family RiPP precursor [Acidobacteriota bacterium]
MSDWSQEEIQTATREIVRRAATDADFRARAMSDPASVVKEVTGRDLPADFKVRFVDSEGANIVVPLPPVVSDGELSDEQLEEVAGGSRCGGSCGVSCALSWA